MPELPEVEYTLRQLRPEIIGTYIDHVEVYWVRTISRAVSDFQSLLQGKLISNVRRYGKLLLLDIENDFVLSIHRRMTGNLLLLPAGWHIDVDKQHTDPEQWRIRGPEIISPEETSQLANGEQVSHCRVAFYLQDGRLLLFLDKRKFGRMHLVCRSEEGSLYKELGPEALSLEFSPDYLLSVLNRYQTPIKTLLLRQNVLAGLGNIYADESLFHAGIHPTRQANSLSNKEVHQLHTSILEVLQLGIQHGGTSLSDYRGLWGEVGTHYEYLHVYHHAREEKYCSTCGSHIEHLVIAQRTAHFCPVCQQ